MVRLLCGSTEDDSSDGARPKAWRFRIAFTSTKRPRQDFDLGGNSVLQSWVAQSTVKASGAKCNRKIRYNRHFFCSLPIISNQPARQPQMEPGRLQIADFRLRLKRQSKGCKSAICNLKSAILHHVLFIN